MTDYPESEYIGLVFAAPDLAHAVHGIWCGACRDWPRQLTTGRD